VIDVSLQNPPTTPPPKPNVPTPQVIVKDITDVKSLRRGRFHRPKFYIRFEHVLKHELFEIALEYDMDDQDEAWLVEFNKFSTKALSELNFERIIAVFERINTEVTNIWVLFLEKVFRCRWNFDNVEGIQIGDWRRNF
jgi:hypothetical protein